MAERCHIHMAKVLAATAVCVCVCVASISGIFKLLATHLLPPPTALLRFLLSNSNRTSFSAISYTSLSSSTTAPASLLCCQRIKPNVRTEIARVATVCLLMLLPAHFISQGLQLLGYCQLSKLP